MYTYEEAYQASVDWFNSNELAAKVFVDKYALRNKDNQFLELTPTDMIKRIAKEFARIEKKKFKDPLTYNEIFNYLDKFARLVPQGSPLFGIGNKEQVVSISNCFVLEPPVDSYGGIAHVDEQLVQISKRRGGVGIDLSKLRPEGSPTHNSSRHSTGIITWMNRYSDSIREVGQGGRRGALMLTLNVHHPQVLDFIKAKNDDVSVTGANISVQYTDEFLKAVENDEEYEQKWPIDSEVPDISKMVRARDIWEAAVHNAWQRAEPGLQFIDKVFNESPADCYADFGFKTITSNPCSEIYLSVLDSCRLFAINLFYYVTNPFEKDASFDFDLFYKDAQVSQRLMDNLVDLEIEKINAIIKKIKADPEEDRIKAKELDTWERVLKACVDGRRTGLGITGLGDTLAALNIKYGSKKSIEVVDEIYKNLKLGAYRASVDMAKELGPFSCWNHTLEKDCPFIDRIKDEDPILYADMRKHGRRNIALLTTAPTGSISMLSSMSIEVDGETVTRHNISSGIEPVFMLEFTRRKKGNPGDQDFRSDFVDKTGDHWMEFKVYHSGLELWKLKNPRKKIENSPYHGACSPDIDWINRVKLQAAAQKHVDHSISSTINLPNDVKEETVNEIYMTSWKHGCKGITVYRDGCRSGVLVSESESELPEERPKELDCDVHHITVRGQEYFVLVGLIDDRPYEVFAGKNGIIKKKVKTGKIIRKRKDFYKAIFDDENELSPITACMDEMEECISRLTSSLLRSGMDMHFVVKQLEKVGGRQTEIHTFAKCLSRVLKKYIPDGTETGDTCPECSEKTIRENGCITCRGCGWSKCM